MRERVRDIERLQHISDAINIIMEHKDEMELDEVIKNPILYFGYVKHLEIIGEAVYKLTKEFKANHSEVEWDAISGLRHILVHGYYQINPYQVWNIIQNDIPVFKPKIEKYIREEQSEK